MAGDRQLHRLREQALALYRCGVEAARPGRAVATALIERDIARSLQGRCHVVAIGKAGGDMMRAALDNLPAERLGERLVVTNHENKVHVPGVDVRYAGHPVPDKAGLEAARDVERLASALTTEDVLLCLVSGGGSALLPAPVDGVSLDDKIRVNELLLASGADIRATNLVRQSLSRLKGGGLARSASPARVISLVLSDVIGDDLRVVASGPTVAPIGTREEAAKTLRDLGLWQAVPDAVRRVLRTETPAISAVKVDAHLVGSNSRSLCAMRDAAGDSARIVDESLVGPVEHATQQIVAARHKYPRYAGPVVWRGNDCQGARHGAGGAQSGIGIACGAGKRPTGAACSLGLSQCRYRWARRADHGGGGLCRPPDAGTHKTRRWRCEWFAGQQRQLPRARSV